jgi:hypothetical protein
MDLLNLIETLKRHKVTLVIFGLATFTYTVIIQFGNISEAVIKIREMIYEPEENSLVNIELVIDRSEEINDQFGGSTKLKAIIKNINQVFGSEVSYRDNIALRQFGGSCDGDNTNLLMPFSKGNREKIVGELKNITPLGKRTLVSAIVEGTSDFNNPDKFGKYHKAMIIFTGGVDACNHNAEELIEKRLKLYAASENQIHVSYRYFGIGLNENEKKIYENIARKTHGAVYFIENDKQLESKLTDALREIKKYKYLSGNLLSNASFEDGLKYWQVGGSPALEQSINLSDFSKNIDEGLLKCRAEVDLALPNNTLGELRVEYKLSNGNVVFGGSSGEKQFSELEWHRVRVISAVPKRARYAEFQIKNKSIKLDNNDAKDLLADSPYLGCFIE